MQAGAALVDVRMPEEHAQRTIDGSINIFGPRQAADSPYSGVIAIFCTRLANDLPPVEAASTRILMSGSSAITDLRAAGAEAHYIPQVDAQYPAHGYQSPTLTETEVDQLLMLRPMPLSAQYGEAYAVEHETGEMVISSCGMADPSLCGAGTTPVR